MDEKEMLIKAERSLATRAADEWVDQTGVVTWNSSWHSELVALVGMAFDKGREAQRVADGTN